MTMALESLDGIRVVGQAENGRAGVEATLEHQPDLVLMDILMPLLDGLEATRRIKRESPACKILVLTGVVGSDAVLDVLRAGASGLVPKTAELSEVETAIRVVGRGEIYVSPQLAGPVLATMASRPADDVNAGLFALLSGREREVIQLIGEGHSTQEIASGLYISPKTGAQHKANMVKKLSLKSTRDLQILAARRIVARQAVV